MKKYEHGVISFLYGLYILKEHHSDSLETNWNFFSNKII